MVITNPSGIPNPEKRIIPNVAIWPNTLTEAEVAAVVANEGDYFFVVYVGSKDMEHFVPAIGIGFNIHSDVKKSLNHGLLPEGYNGYNLDRIQMTPVETGNRRFTTVTVSSIWTPELEVSLLLLKGMLPSKYTEMYVQCPSTPHPPLWEKVVGVPQMAISAHCSPTSPLMDSLLSEGAVQEYDPEPFIAETWWYRFPPDEYNAKLTEGVQERKAIRGTFPF